jgi:hypothetical protein
MAILDRPMFQRPLTKDQLRAYGIPAFANGGIVRMQTGGDPSGLFTPGGTGQKIKEAKEAQPKIMLSDVMGTTSATASIESQIRRLETLIANKKASNPDADTSAEEAKLAELKKELIETGQEAVKDIATPVPEDIRTAKTTTELKEAILKGKGPGQDEIIEEKTASITDTLGAPEKERLSDLESLVRERSDLYKKILGDPKEGLKQQGLLQLAQFGLNLASAKGGTFAEKIANSAKDPLQAFAALGREAMKDERAIDMIAIKGAEEELGRTQKPGTFGQLVQDLINSKGLSPEKAAEEATRIYEQKSGKTIAEMKDERYSELLALYTQELGEVDKAVNAADAQIKKEFGTGMFIEQNSKETVETGGNIVEIDSDAEFEALEPGTQYRNKGETQVRVK